MISASTDAQQQETLIEKYMQLPNQVRTLPKLSCIYLSFGQESIDFTK